MANIWCIGDIPSSVWWYMSLLPPWSSHTVWMLLRGDWGDIDNSNVIRLMDCVILHLVIPITHPIIHHTLHHPAYSLTIGTALSFPPFSSCVGYIDTSIIHNPTISTLHTSLSPHYPSLVYMYGFYRTLPSNRDIIGWKCSTQCKK